MMVSYSDALLKLEERKCDKERKTKKIDVHCISHVKKSKSPKGVDEHEIIKSLKKMNRMVHKYDAMCFSPTTWHVVEQALLEFVMRNDGLNSFFMSSNELKDYIANMEYLSYPLLVLTWVNKEQSARMNLAWLHSDNVLPMPVRIITFSNDDLCYPEPNHNQPPFVSVEHRNKVVKLALVSQGS